MAELTQSYCRVLVLGFCLLGLGAMSATTSRAGETIVSWDFSRTSDANFDNLPDGWQRVYGRQYPRYLKMEIRPHDAAEDLTMRKWDAWILRQWRTIHRNIPQLPELPPSIADSVVNRYLSATIDGGAIAGFSPPFDVSAEYSYRLMARIRTDGLTNNSAWLELNFLSAEGESIQSHSTPAIQGTQQWTQVQIAPVTVPVGATQCRITVRYEPSEKADMTGSVGFDDIVVDRMPRIRILGDAPQGLYADKSAPKLRCLVSGLAKEFGNIQFRLLNEKSEPLLSFGTPLRELSSVEQAEAYDASALLKDGYGGIAEWQLPQLDPGFYRVRVDLTDLPAFEIDLEYTFAVLSDLPTTPGPFGWSLASSNPTPIPLKAIPEWISQCRVHWLKYPCWSDPQDYEHLENVAWLMNRLQDRSIRSVGVLCNPPAKVLTDLDAKPGDLAALLFRDKSLWQPALEPVMSRLSNGVRWWQLGDDEDFSFLGRAQLQQTIEDIRLGLQGFGQPIQIVINWPWVDPLPPRAEWSWQTVCLNDPLPHTVDEIHAYFSPENSPFRESLAPLDSATQTTNRTELITTKSSDAGVSVTTTESITSKKTNSIPSSSRPIQPWIILDPLSRNEYPMTERIRDLILRMVAVRSYDIQAAFISDPFDSELAFLRSDGMPDEMLLPWRTTSALIGSLKPVGSLQLESRSYNVVLADEKQIVLVLWSNSPTTETLYLGDDARQIDAFGRLVPMEAVTKRNIRQHRVKVTPEPTFVIGMDRITALWSLSVQLDRKRIDSLLGREQTIQMSLVNPAPQTISGNFKVEAPESWSVGKFARPMSAEPLRPRTETISLVLKLDATIGRERLAIDFDLEGDRPRQFTVFRDIEVGPEDLEVSVSTRLLPDGRLVVRQEITSLTQKNLRFDCSVYAPGRQRQRRSISVPGMGQVQQEFIWPDGNELIGQQMLLRAEEMEGQRTLNFRFKAFR